jgi:hypothetical protein
MRVRHLTLCVTVAVLLSLVACGGKSRLDAVVNTAGGNYGTAQINSGIRDLAIYKDVDKGTVIIAFDWDQSKAGYPHIVGKAFLVRLFDKNGQYLTHFTTEPLLELMGRDELTKKHFEFTYEVNLRDLEVAQQAEFGGMI